ncbi:MAG TPA: lytic transglycosylase domain-containing protein [Ktedonobacteraceae bacterium]|nr:lytic transglycosylase domain-containing protein [Ktedonobacteraceae bacterium]
MQQFRPLSSFQDEVEDVSTINAERPARDTQAQLDTVSLLTALQSTMTASTTGRMVVIPGGMKRSRIDLAKTASRRRMNPRLRFGLICGIVLFILGYTLFTLTPLDAQGNRFPTLSAFGNWVRQETLNLAISSHMAPVAQQTTASTQSSTSMPSMTLPTSQYIAIAQQDAIAAGISPVYFVRQINQESGFNPYAVSPAGALGIAQFEPGTAAGLGIDPWNPVQALRGAAQLMANYARNYGGNYAEALAAYNGGSGTVQYALNACGAANWMNCLPAETRHYIYVIMGI